VLACLFLPATFFRRSCKPYNSPDNETFLSDDLARAAISPTCRYVLETRRFPAEYAVFSGHPIDRNPSGAP